MTLSKKQIEPVWIKFYSQFEGKISNQKCVKT